MIASSENGKKIGTAINVLINGATEVIQQGLNSKPYTKLSQANRSHNQSDEAIDFAGAHLFLSSTFARKMKTETNETYAYFCVRGDFDPKEISTALGLVPTESWMKGDMDSKRKKKRHFSKWALYSKLPKTEPLDSHIANVLDQLKEKKEEVRAIAESFDGCLQLVGYFYDQEPGFHMTRERIKSVADLSLEIDYDFYHIPENQKDANQSCHTTPASAPR